MAYHKLDFEEDFEEEYFVIGIYSTDEPYKIAFLLNKYAGLHLKRRQTDLEFSNKGLEINFPTFQFETEFQYITFTLIANKNVSHEAYIASSGGLFDEVPSEKSVQTYLLPEFKKVDYVLKISGAIELEEVQEVLSKINKIMQIISAFIIQPNLIKSYNNLILK